MTAVLDIEDALQMADRYRFHICDVGLLASALARPTTTVMGVEAYPDLGLKAAALLESVARFHPLTDGNKRTAWTLMVLLLWIKGTAMKSRLMRASTLLSGWRPVTLNCGTLPR